MKYAGDRRRTNSYIIIGRVHRLTGTFLSVAADRLPSAVLVDVM